MNDLKIKKHLTKAQQMEIAEAIGHEVTGLLQSNVSVFPPSWSGGQMRALVGLMFTKGRGRQTAVAEVTKSRVYCQIVL